MLKVTEVRIVKHEVNNLKGFASITLEDAFVVDGFRIVEGDNGLFVGKPSKKTKEGKFKNTAFPLNKELGDSIDKAILDAYEQTE